MAVYKQTYKGYAGPLTDAWPRFLILTRYSYARLFKSRLLVIFMVVCLFYPVACAAFIYLSHNSKFLALLGIPRGQLLSIDSRFFYYYCVVQGAMTYLLTALVGPTLISPDLVNGALPLYFCRPFSRTQYIAGKIGALLALLSLITWVPGVILFVIEASVTGWEWGGQNLWMLWGLFFGLAVWIVVVSLIALALSAWVKWKIAAGALVLAVFFAGAGFGSAIDSVLRTRYGALIDLTQVVHTIQSDLLHFDAGFEITPLSAWIVLGVTAALSLALLVRRLRAFEVVR